MDPFHPMTYEERRKSYFNDLMETEAHTVIDYYSQKCGGPKYSFIYNIAHFSFDTSLKNAVTICIEKCLAFAIETPTQTIVAGALLSAGMPAGAAGLVASIVASFFCFIGSNFIFDGLFSFFSGTIYIDPRKLRKYRPIEKPKDYDDGGPGGIEFRGIKPILFFDSIDNIFSDKVNIFFKTEFKEDVEYAFNSICLPEFRGKKIQEYFETIMREVSNGIDIFQELPFISLEFNNDHSLYSIMPAYYKKTLIGNVLTFLDYFMKGFVNGGYFTIDFIHKWIKQPPNNRTKDLKILNANLVDIRKVMKKNHIRYKSIYDLIDQNKFTEDFSSAFRIIGEMSEININDGIIFPEETFKVEHDFYPSPHLQKQLSKEESKVKEIDEIISCYYKMRDIIKKTMIKVPEFRGYFVILDMITYALHYHASLSSIGKKVQTPNAFQITNKEKEYVNIIPDVFPPLPILEQKKIVVEVTIGEIIDSLKTTSLEKEIQQILINEQPSYSADFIDEMQIKIKELYRNKVSAIMGEDFQNYDDEDIEVDSFVKKIGLGTIFLFPYIIKNKMYELFSEIANKIKNINNENITLDAFENMNYVQIEKECQRLYAIIKDHFESKVTKLLDLRKQIMAQSANFLKNLQIDEYNKNVDKLNNLKKDLESLIEEMEDYNFNPRIEFYSQLARQFFKFYEHGFNLSFKKSYSICIWKPVIKESNNNIITIGGCLVNVTKTPRFHSNPTPTKLTTEIHSFIESRNANEEFIKCSNDISGFVVSLDISSSYLDGSLLACSRLDDFFKGSDRGINDACVSHYAAHFGLIDILDKLPDEKINAQTNDNLTPAFFACFNNKVLSIDYLIKRNADFGYTNANDISPFLATIMNDNYDAAMTLLLNDKANIGNINQSDKSGKTALFWAIQYDHLDIVKLLLDKNASIKSTLKSNGMTPIHFACYTNKPESLILLANKDKDKIMYSETQAGFTPLQIAIAHSSPCANFILEQKKDALTAIDPCGFTLHDIAILNGEYEIAQKLPKSGKIVFNIYNDSHDSKDGEFDVLCQALGSGDLSFAETTYENWYELYGQNILTSDQKKRLIKGAFFGRCPEFVELLSRNIDLSKYPDLAIKAAKYGLEDWIIEIQKYGGNVLTDAAKTTIFDIAVENSDHKFLQVAFKIINDIPDIIIKRIIKRSIELNNFDTMATISIQILKGKKYFCLLSPSDILFSSTSPLAYQIYQQNLDKKIGIKLKDFILTISSDLLMYLLKNCNFDEDDLINACKEALNNKRNFNAFLIVDANPSLIDKIAEDTKYSKIRKFTNEKRTEALNALAELNEQILCDDNKKVQQLQKIFSDIFDLSDFGLAQVEGQSIQNLWILKALPKWCINGFHLMNNAFDEIECKALLKKIYSIFDKLYKPDIGKVVLMFMNSLKKLNFAELNWKRYGDDFISALFDVLRFHYDAVDDDNNTIFHIASKFKNINEENIKLIIKTLKKMGNNLIDKKNRFGETIIMNLAASGNYDAFEEIDKMKADLKIRDIYGDNILHKLINGEMASNDKIFNLITKIINRYPEMILQKNRKGKSPFMAAAKKGFKGIIGLMATVYPINILDIGTNKSILHLAAKHNNAETVRYIVQYLHIDVNIKSETGLTPLHYAAMKSSSSAFKELIKLGGNLLIPDENSMNAIDYALRFGTNEIINIVTNTATFNYLLSSFRTIANFAYNPVAYKAFSKYSQYIDQKVFDECDEHGNNFISIACQSNNRKMVSDLLFHQFDPEKTSFAGYNSIHICALHSSIGCSTLILDYIHGIKGQDGVKSILNKQDIEGNLPIHIAAIKGYSGFLVHLLSACKDQEIEKENNLQHSVLAESIINDHFKITGIITGFLIDVLGKTYESILNSLRPELKNRFEEITKLNEFIVGKKMAKEIKDFEYSKHPIERSQNLIGNSSYISNIEDFKNLLKESGVSIPQKLIDQCSKIINNCTFQLIITLIITIEKSANNINLIFESIANLKCPRIRDISCLILLPRLQKSSYIMQLLEMIKQVDDLKIDNTHILFSWIENGLISVAENEHKPESLLKNVQNVVDCIIYINKNADLENSIQFPVLPAPIHIVYDTIKKFENERIKKIQFKFINFMKVSMLWNKIPTLSIDFCNRIENKENSLFKYVLENNFESDVIERVIQIIIDLYQNNSLSDSIRKMILDKCKQIIEKDKANKFNTLLKIQIGAWETNNLKVIQKYGIAYLKNNLKYISCASLEMANRSLAAIATIGNPEIANKHLIKDVLKLEKKAAEIEKSRFNESRNLDEIIQAFDSGSNEFIPYRFAFDGTPVVKLTESELKSLKAFGQLVETKRNFMCISDKAQELGRAFRDKPSILNAARLVYLVRSVIREVFNINPFIVQCLAVGGLLLHRINKNIRPQLKGRIAQIATGEGKSIIVAMLASCIALTGNTVDIISSSIYLAQRDAEKFKPFYEKLGLSCGFISENATNDFDFHILYSTNTEFEFALLREGIKGKTTIETTLLYENVKRHRPYMSVIVDEVDNLFIDTAMNSARIAEKGNNKQSWIFKPIWEEVCSNNYDTIQIRNKLSNVANNENQLKVLNEISDSKLNNLIKSAIYANKELQKDVDYVVGFNKETQEKEVQIVDSENTGRIQYGSRWSNGLHEFVELKEGLPNNKMSFTVASISHPSFFELYQEIYGLTGTLGEDSEREEIKNVYHVDTFDVPPNKKCLRKREKTLILKTDEKKMEIIIDKINEMIELKRPILIIVLTIEESKKLSKLLDSNKINHYVLNDQQQQDEDFIVNKAGNPEAVTIATNTAGRGTDIHINKQALANGGLHTLITFFPANLRVECQALGRSGRQGNPGSCQIIFTDNDLGSDDINNSNDEILQLAYYKRSIKIQKQSETRMYRLEKEFELFNILKDYFEFIRLLTSFLESSESISLLKDSNLNSLTILNELTENWMIYFSSISSDDDEIERSFDGFLKKIDFQNKYPTLWNNFSQIYSEKSLNNKIEVETKPKEEKKMDLKKKQNKILRFPSEPYKPPPILSYIDENQNIYVDEPNIIKMISSSSDQSALQSASNSIDIIPKLKIKFFFDKEFREFTDEFPINTLIHDIELIIEGRYNLNNQVILQYDDNDGNRVNIDPNCSIDSIIDEMTVIEPDGQIQYHLFIAIDKNKKTRSNKYSSILRSKSNGT